MKYQNEYTQEISFPLGGIGTGCIGLDGGGRLIDWEIFNRPAKGSIVRYSHFAIKAIRDGKPITYMLQSDYTKSYTGAMLPDKIHRYGHGVDATLMCGFPHFSHSEFVGEFPMANVRFTDPEFPAVVTLTAYNPMIPGDDKNSSLPAAFFEIEIENTADEVISYIRAAGEQKLLILVNTKNRPVDVNLTFAGRLCEPILRYGVRMSDDGRNAQLKPYGYYVVRLSQ